MTTYRTSQVLRPGEPDDGVETTLVARVLTAVARNEERPIGEPEVRWIAAGVCRTCIVVVTT